MKNQYNLLNLIIILSCYFFVSYSSNASTNICLPDQSFALLQLKREFALKKNPYLGSQDDASSYPKMKTWNSTSDCCSWDGVECNPKTGQVVSLNLSSSWLYGPLNSNSSLFSLPHLQKLDLASNNFNFSQIPPMFGRLGRLTHLNLANSMFSGKIPSQISWLNKLVFLDLSSSYNYDSNNFMYLTKRDTARFIRNMTNLRELHLDMVDISSSLPASLVNLSSLSFLSLSGCNLQGQFPESVFLLPKLQSVNVSGNNDLTGFLPEFHSGSNLKSLVVASTKFSGSLPNSIGSLSSLHVLDLQGCNFFGELPDSIGNLKSLNVLNLWHCNFSGTIPSSLWNLSQLTNLDLSSNGYLDGQLPSEFGNLANLIFLDLSFDEFSGEIPSSIANLTRLKYLSLSDNNFGGRIPTSLGNLNQLIYLDLSHNFFDGEFPKSMANLTHQLVWLDLSYNQLTGPLSNIQNITSSKLEYLSLSENKLNGPIPSSIFKMTNLEELYLDSNNLSGIVEMGMIFSELSKLSFLHLSANSLSIANNRTTISTSSTNFPKFQYLFLSSCNIIGEFPEFLKSQDELVALDLSNNKIEGQIPKWFWSLGIETLSLLNLSHNYISNLEQAPLILPWKNLFYLDLHSNMLQGPFVVPPLSTSYFFISKNNLTGKIHPLFCKLSHLEILDVSYNQLGGSIPHCLASLSSSLLVLNLQRNNFHGNIPQPCREGSKLKTLELSHNQLQGNVPKSLIKCSKLEFLNFGHNQISDKFPSWLENLPELQVLVLRSNKFHGPIWNGQKHFSFSKLRIIDLSFNNFSGNIPLESFRDWLSMTRILDGNKSQLSYMGDDRYDYYQNSVTVMSKGLEMVLVKIVTLFNSIDLSNNRFEGEIPSSIGDLQYLIVLNLSSNSFTGLIPSSLGNLTELESLDLSRNQLSGGIPQQLLSLTFLSHLNLSHNQLTGQIPQGRQFDTFPSSSFVGNLGLCGPPLLKKCENVGTPTPHPTQESNTGNINFGWKVVAVGYGCGMIIGVFIEHLIAARKPTWFLRSFLGILYR